MSAWVRFAARFATFHPNLGLFQQTAESRPEPQGRNHDRPHRLLSVKTLFLLFAIVSTEMGLDAFLQFAQLLPLLRLQIDRGLLHCGVEYGFQARPRFSAHCRKYALPK